MKYVSVYNSPLGQIYLAERDGAITDIGFGAPPEQEEFQLVDTSILAKMRTQLQEYFAHERTEFTVPLAPEGTAFQKSVWNALQKIPYGETRSYGEIAQAIGNPAACRAVGLANHNNPIAIVIPCHRVIGANGALTGYASGLAIKRQLLELEGNVPGFR